MKSLIERFNGNAKEVLECTREKGKLGAMREYDIHDLLCFDRYLEEIAPGEEFAMVKTEPEVFSREDTLVRTIEAFCNQMQELTIKLQVERQKNSELTKKLEYYQHGRWDEVKPAVNKLLQYCEGCDKIKRKEI